MLKLKRYMKPYLGFLLAAVLLLFGQAMLELELPNMMSNIVNIGIQQGGITQAAPDAIDADAMALMKQFMSTEDQAVVDEAYSPFDSLADTDKLYKTYPEADGTTLALTGDGSAASGALANGTKILGNRFSAAAAAQGNAPLTGRSVPSKATSPMKTLSEKSA